MIQKDVSFRIQEFLNEYEWPSSVEAFELPALVVPESNKYFHEIKKAKIVSMFEHDEHNLNFFLPNMIHTNLDQPCVPLHEVSICENARNIISNKNEIIEPGAFNKLLNDRCDYVIVSGASGAGKTRWTRELAYHEFVILLDASPHKESNSSDNLERLIDSLDYKTNNVETKLEFTQRLRYILLIRAEVLKAAFAKYGKDTFLPRHWMGLQVLSGNVLHVPDFFKLLLVDHFTEIPFEELDKYVNEKGNDEIAKLFKAVVIDEAQVFVKVTEFFGSNENNPIKNSLLRYLNSNLKIIFSGTSFSVAKALDLPIENKTKVRFFGVTRFFNENDVIDSLKHWGIHNFDYSLATTFIGVPRFASYVAHYAIKNDLTSEQAAVFTKQLFFYIISRVLNLVEDLPSSNKKNEAVFRIIRQAAYDYIMGGNGVINDEQIDAINFGFGSLKMIDNKVATVFAEPLMIHTFRIRCLAPLEKRIGDELNETIIGTEFEKFLACHSNAVLEYVVKELKVLNLFSDWKINQVVPSERFVIKLIENKDDETEILKKIMEDEKGMYPSVIFPTKNFGTDVIIIGKNELNTQKKWLLIKIQTKRRFDFTLSKARLRLESPYGPLRKNKTINKETIEAKIRSYNELEKQCQVVHLICRQLGRKKDKVKITKNNIVEIVFNQSSWRNNVFLEAVNKDIAPIVKFHFKSNFCII